jgi:subtilase family serine protease
MNFFQKRGTVYVASSGDTSGSRLYPAASPFVVAVGGTTLPLDRKGHRIGPETGWSASGGGPSNFEPEPKYQTEFTIKSGGRRAIPDVSFIADPNTGVSVFTSTPTSNGTTGWIIVGGTSLSSPCWAAIIALADKIRKKPLEYAHHAIYNLATGAKRYSQNYRDIRIGCADGFCCTPGYDFVTGLGSPRANHLVLALGGHRKKH